MTQVSWRRQLVLAATLFVLGTLAYWLEYKHRPQREESEEQSKKLFALKDTPVQSFEVSDGTRTFALECVDLAQKLCKTGDNSKWKLTAPMAAKADDSNGNSMLSAVQNLNVSETIDLKDETPAKRKSLLKEYGLDEDARKTSAVKRLSVRTESGASTLYLGLTHPIGESIFGILSVQKKGAQASQIDETKIYLVPNYFKVNFEHDLTYWRDKKLFSIASHEVDGFALKGPKSGTELQGSKKNGLWTLQGSAGELPGDAENIESLVSAATFLVAKSFVTDRKDGPAAKKALAGLKQTLTLSLKREKPASGGDAPAPLLLTIFEKGSAKPSQGKVLATVSNMDPLFELDANSRERLDKSLKDLRLSKLLTSMDRFTAKRLEFSGGGFKAPLVLKQVDNKWTRDTKPVSQPKVTALLDKLSGNRIKDFKPAKAGAKDPASAVKLTLGDEKNEKKREVLLWREGKDLFARDLQSPRSEILTMDASIASELAWEPDDFDEKPAVPPPAAAPAAAGTPPNLNALLPQGGPKK